MFRNSQTRRHWNGRHWKERSLSFETLETRSLLHGVGVGVEYDPVDQQPVDASDTSWGAVPFAYESVETLGSLVSYSGLNYPGDRANPEATARAFLSAFSDSLQLAANSSELQLQEVKQGLASAVTRFQRVVDGLPVVGAYVSVNQGPNGAIDQLFLDNHSDLTFPSAGPVAVSLSDAESFAIASAGINATTLPSTGQMVWYPNADGSVTLAWQVMVSDHVEHVGDYYTIVDANSGDVLFQENRVRFDTGTGDVFYPNPYQTQGSGTGLTDANDANSAALAAQEITVTLQGLNAGTGLLVGEFVDLATLNSPTQTDVDANETTRVYQYTRDNPRFEQVVVYHSIDSFERYFESLGFDDDVGVANGIRDFATKANAHWYTQDQSFFSSADNAVHFGDGGVDDAEDGDIIAHEFGHAVQFDQNAGFNGGETGAMGEGFGDYLAASFFADQGDATFQASNAAAVGEWDATSYSSTNPPALRRVDGPKKYGDRVGEVHADGEIWSATLWDLRQVLGRTLTDTLVLESHFLLPAAATMRQGGLAIIQADANLTGGQNEAAIRIAFCGRDIFTGADCVLPADFGDAPDTYGTLAASSGPRHTALGPLLGPTRDTESDGAPTTGATGDGADEDGVTFGNLRLGQTATITVNVTGIVSGTAMLDAWIDYDRNGVFDATSERITAVGGTVVSNGDNALSVAIPAGATAGQTYARFRLSTAGGLNPTGATPADDGEVEDYAVTLGGGGGGGPVGGTNNGNDIIGRTTSGQWWVGHNNGTTFVNEQYGSWVGNAVRDVTSGDFDGDGLTDIIGRTVFGVWTVGHNTGSSFVNQTFGQWYEAIGWRDVTYADFTGDGLVDVIGRTSQGQWWLGANDGTQFVNQLFGYWDETAHWRDVMPGDFNGDGTLDMVGRTATGQWWLAGNAGANFVNQPYGGWYEGALWRDVMAGDFNHDGSTDVVGRTSTGGWWLGISSAGAGFVNMPFGQWNEAAGWQDVMVGDYTGDAFPDVIGRTAGGDWWIGQTNFAIGAFQSRRFGAWNLIEPGDYWRDVTQGDFDNDGRLDVLGRSANTGIWWLGRNQGSYFFNNLWGFWNESLGWRDVGLGDFGGASKTSEISPAPNESETNDNIALAASISQLNASESNTARKAVDRVLSEEGLWLQ